MNEFILNKIEKENNKIVYHYNILGAWQKYFKLDEVFFVEYENLNLEDIPDSILVIPLLANILPIAWVADGKISVGEIDKAFYDSIKEIKQGYIDMYPRVDFRGDLQVESIVDNSYVPSGKTAAFFSGGVDAFNTLVAHSGEKPALVTLWGSDITLDDSKGWQRVRSHAEKTGNDFSCDNVFIKTSFRKFLNEGTLSNMIMPMANDGWWHGFQHGIGLIGHIAPYAFKNKLSTIYIASSFTAKDKGKVTCASDPTIDNHVRIASCYTVHDGYENTRQEKVRNICTFKKRKNQSISLRVCWQSDGGSNCCACEKCYRTICAIIAEGENPREMGFVYDDGIFKRMEKDINYKFIFDDVMRTYWCEIQKRFKGNYEDIAGYKKLSWLFNVDFKSLDIKMTISKRLYHFCRRIKRKLVMICG